MARLLAMLVVIPVWVAAAALAAPDAGLLLPMPADEMPSNVVAADAGTSGQEKSDELSIDVVREDKELRDLLQLVIVVIVLVGGAALFVVWRRLKVLSDAAIQIDVDDRPGSAAPGETISVGVTVCPDYDLEHGGLSMALVMREYPGPRARKERLTEETVLELRLEEAGTIRAKQCLERTATLEIPGGAAPSYDHAFGVDLPDGRTLMRHWVLQARLEVGDGEALAERLCDVREGEEPVAVGNEVSS